MPRNDSFCVNNRVVTCVTKNDAIQRRRRRRQHRCRHFAQIAFYVVVTQKTTKKVFIEKRFKDDKKLFIRQPALKKILKKTRVLTEDEQPTTVHPEKKLV